MFEPPLTVKPSGRPAWRLPLLVAGACVALFWAAGLVHLNGFRIQLGSFQFPTGGFSHLSALLLNFAAPAAIALAVLLHRCAALPSVARLAEDWRTADDRKSIALASALALLIPLAIRSAVLNGAPVADDEAAYRFSAQLLASFRLSVPSHVEKLFFDNAFLVNDGAMYSQYPLGWPALLAVGERLGAPWLMNPLYSAATVPALFLIMRRFVGSAWARLGLVIYLASPLLMMTAATYLSQTSSLMALAWATWFCLKSRDEGAPWWAHFALAAFLALGFFIRPMSALTFGLPLGLAWLHGLTRPATPRLAAAVAFAVPALVLAACFLAINAALTGAPLTTGYQRYFRYVIENGGRFAPWQVSPDTLAHTVPNVRWYGLLPALASAGTTLLRVNIDGFGWPFSMLFVPFAVRRAPIVAASFGSFLAGFLMYDAGIDTFGPNHAVEVMGPLVVLTIVGAKVMSAWLARSVKFEPPVELSGIPVSVLAALVMVALATHIPVRLHTLGALAEDINAPLLRVEEAQLTNAVVFTFRPFAHVCRNPGNRHFVYFRPNSTPAMDGDVVWANHLTLERDRALVATHFPNRKGYLLGIRPDCTYELAPLEALQPDKVPSADPSDVN